MSKQSNGKRTGREFEALIAWIQKCVHNRAKIETNIRVRDIDTGKLRQIDVGLRLSDMGQRIISVLLRYAIGHAQSEYDTSKRCQQNSVQ